MGEQGRREVEQRVALAVLVDRLGRVYEELGARPRGHGIIAA
jgi:hypothetical protein